MKWGHKRASVAKQPFTLFPSTAASSRKADLGDTEMLRSLVNVGFWESAAQHQERW